VLPANLDNNFKNTQLVMNIRLSVAILLRVAKRERVT